jgi:thiosulfate/3-mercaptopyruvate sulfurtransferase
MFSTLISAQDLAQHVSDPNWLVIDCRFDLAQPDSGERAYREGHIPGAVYAHLDRDLSSPITKHTGRHPLPHPSEFAKRLGEWGVSRDTQVIAHDADTGAYAARLWWLLRWVGHEAVAVLDGGLRAWREAGFPLTTDIPMRSPTHFEPHPDRSAWLSAEEVAAKLRDGWRLLDARAPERFAGKVEPIDPIAGHIPGAVNHPLTTNLGVDSRFLSAEELRKRYSASQAGVSDDRTIAMCGSGVTACHLLLAMEIAGKKGARLYAGSWSEWIRDPTRPIAIGGEWAADGGP